MKQANFYKKLEEKAVRCQLCNHSCAIKNNGVGLCNVRKNKEGILYSLVYGYPAALNIDPVEKKPLYHFQPGSLTYSLGTFGCNFRCANCQNWDLSQAQNIENSVADMNYVEPEEIIEGAAEECSSISFTYNEPTIFTEYSLDIMKLAHSHGLKNIWVSNGFMSKKCLEAISPYLDAINVDLKSMEEEFYEKNCQARLKPVLENLKAIKKAGIHLEITTLIIPTLSDDPDTIKKIAEFIVNELGSDVPWHLSKFSPAISWKLKRLPATPDDAIYHAYEIGKSAGLKYVYVGNIPGDQKENTHCPICGELAIRRFGYEIERLDKSGRCPSCDKNLDIIE